MDKSFTQELLYPPQPLAMTEFDERACCNFSTKMYGQYAREPQQHVEADQPIVQSFLAWHRLHRYDSAEGCVRRAIGMNCMTAFGGSSC